MTENLPYSTSVGTLERMLEKIIKPTVPERFTQDFVNTKLQMKGGTANSCIPFLKKMGFVASDGSPTDLYREYRNPAKRGTAIAKAVREVYSRLYEMNEYVHDASDEEVLGLIVECTGSEPDSSVTKFTLATFNMLRKKADFDAVEQTIVDDTPEAIHQINSTTSMPQTAKEEYTADDKRKINLSYTINLNLPVTKDIEVFNAIFKSLKQHILDS